MTSAHAASIDQPLMDGAQEKIAHRVFRELRCVVCEGQSLAESDATLAVQMRLHVRELVAEGKSEDEILAYFRDRYGEQILLTPPLESYTVLLWLAPLLLLAGGGYAVWRVTRQKNGEPS
jgi:cytochrome c-type biogenesis protein CcmH